MHLYLVTNIIDGTMYVGKTARTIADRWNDHLSRVRRGSEFHLHRAIRKYGVENFTIEPLVLLESDFSDEVSLNDGERLMIRLLRKSSRLYNLTDGGEGASGWIPSDETRHKMREAHKGKTFTGEHRRKIGDAQRGKQVSEQERQRLNAMAGNCKGRKLSPDHIQRLTTVNRGPEWKRKIAAAKRGTGKGYTFHKATGKYAVSVKVNRKCVHVGLFATEVEALEARRRWEIENWGYTER